MGKIVVLGSNSFAGSHLIDCLLSNTGYEIIGISRNDEAPGMFLPYKKNPHIERFRFMKIDFNRDMQQLIQALDSEQPETLINFAAQSEVEPSWKNPADWYRTNVLALVELTNRLKDKKFLKRYIHISSPEIYGACMGNVYEEQASNPSTPYAASKAAGDTFIKLLTKTFNFPAIIIRPTNYYGPGQQLFKIIPRSIIYIKKGKKIPLHSGGIAVKSFLHVKDAAEGVLKIIEHGKTGEIYHLSTTTGYPVKGVVQRICLKMHVHFSEVTENIGERLGQDAVYVINSDKARSLGWKPKISIDEGIADCIRWVEENWEAIKNEPLDYVHQP
ncbi:GDP-mannose 4,6-dehydratase [Candidatus Woesearchaeota archaeon]|nr:GDP-mannose 4,6-dehydratase [Candidatus Woesearchaeota archaeon]